MTTTRNFARALGALWVGLFWPASDLGATEIGDKERGATIWRQCTSCHSVGADAKHRVGPQLNELFDRKAGSEEGFRYSADMLRAGADGLIWTNEALDAYIENPRALVTRTRMSFRGVPDPTDRRDLLAYLRQFSASPADIPESAPTASPTDHSVDPAILKIEGDPEYGEYLSSECVTCHQASGSDDGIPSITGWPTEDFVVVMDAYRAKVRTHPVMQMIAGRLSDEEIAGLAKYFEGVE